MHLDGIDDGSVTTGSDDLLVGITAALTTWGSVEVRSGRRFANLLPSAGLDLGTAFESTAY